MYIYIFIYLTCSSLLYSNGWFFNLPRAVGTPRLFWGLTVRSSDGSGQLISSCFHGRTCAGTTCWQRRHLGAIPSRVWAQTTSMTQVCSAEMALQIHVKTAMRKEIAPRIIPAFQPKQWGGSESKFRVLQTDRIFWGHLRVSAQAGFSQKACKRRKICTSERSWSAQCPKPLSPFLGFHQMAKLGGQ